MKKIKDCLKTRLKQTKIVKTTENEKTTTS
jgi:hypothetical protein